MYFGFQLVSLNISLLSPNNLFTSDLGGLSLSSSLIICKSEFINSFTRSAVSPIEISKLLAALITLPIEELSQQHEMQNKYLQHN